MLLPLMAATVTGRHIITPDKWSEGRQPFFLVSSVGSSLRDKWVVGGVTANGERRSESILSTW